MEVHSHAHHVAHKKKWHEYILEFAMLFLAVFLGFLAENFREHQVEHGREKEYMRTMVEDLKADLPLLDSTMRQWVIANKSVDSVTDAISSTFGKTDLIKVYRHINEALNPWSFKFNDRTIAQLKNAGGFRLLRNEKVANSIIAYDQFNNDPILNIARYHESFYFNAIGLKNKALVQVAANNVYARFAYVPAPATASTNAWIDSILSANRHPMKEEDQRVLLFEMKNALLTYKMDYDANVYWGYKNLRERQVDLIALISKEYDLN